MLHKFHSVCKNCPTPVLKECTLTLLEKRMILTSMKSNHKQEPVLQDLSHEARMQMTEMV